MMKKMKTKFFLCILMIHIFAGAAAATAFCLVKKKKRCFADDVVKKAEKAFREIGDKINC